MSGTSLLTPLMSRRAVKALHLRGEDEGNNGSAGEGLGNTNVNKREGEQVNNYFAASMGARLALSQDKDEGGSTFH